MPPLQGYQSNTPTIAQPADTSTAVPQMAAQQLGNLAQRLEQFSGNMYKMAGDNAKVKAADNAVKDVNNYRQKTNEIMGNENLNQTQKNEQLQSLQQKHEYDGWGHIYKNSYKTAFDASYADTVTTDAKAAAEIASAQSNGDSETFAHIWGKYSRSIVRAAPNEALAATANMALTKYGSSNFKSLATAQYNKKYAVEKASSEKVLTHLQEEYVTAYSNYDQAGMDSAVSQYGAAVKSAVARGFMTEAEAGVNIKVAAEDATVARYYSDFTRTLQESGDTSKVIKSVYNSKEYQMLPRKKKDELMQSMLSDVKAKNARRNEARSNTEFLENEEQEKNYNEILLDIMTVGTTNDNIIRAQIREEISESQAADLKKQLSTKGRPVSDGAKLASYYKDSNLMSVSSDEIMNDPLISYADKNVLFKRQEQLKSTKYKWTTSQNGKEARDRVKRLFGIQEGTFMAQLDMSNQTGKDFDRMYTSLFDEVSNLPQNEQEGQAIAIANRMINEYNNVKISDAELKRQQIEQKKIEKAKARKKDYDESIGYMWDSLFDDKKSEQWFIDKELNRGK